MKKVKGTETEQQTKRVKAAKRNQNKGKNIAGKIQKVVILTLSIAMITLGIFSCYLNYYSTMVTVETDMKEMAVLAAGKVEWQIKSYENILQELGCTARLANSENTVEAKQEIIDEKVKAYGCIRGKLIGLDGIAEVDGTDYNEREYFKEALKGKVWMSEPLVGKTDGSLSIICAAPVWEGGIKDSSVVGVVFLSMQPSLLNDIAASIKISDHSSAYMLSGTGVTIAHQNSELVEQQGNTQEDYKTDSSLKQLAELENRMMKGETGFGSYSYGGETKLMGFAPIIGSNNWSIALTAPKSDFMTDTYVGIGITVVIILLALGIGYVLAIKAGKRIGDPIRACAERLNAVAEGDLHSPVPEINAEDETGILSKSTKHLVTGLNNIIGDVGHLLDKMANGDFTAHSNAEESYIGDFESILQSLRLIKRNLTGALTQIKESSEQVSLGSGQLAENAQTLAEGATEQAGAVEELTATITNVTDMARTSAEQSAKTQQDVENAAREAKQGTKTMEELTLAMQRIDETSQEIQNIIADIESIASQTNLLALNASIEAARAGEAGKGFAVVADQIGKLAAGSAESAVNTRELIVKALEEIKKGNTMTQATSEAFQFLIDSMGNFSKMIEASSESSQQQAALLKEIEQGITQISTVVQSNSASSQETSATSEELSAQAETMNQQVEKFKF